jgi:ATP-dependent helicase/nuclease subunit B
LEKFLSVHKDAWPADPLATLLAFGRDVFAPYRDRPQVAAVWWPRFESIAAWFVAQEQARRQAGIRVLAVEGKGIVTVAGGAFTLRGRADRIDRLPDGTCAIIDYKTGSLPTDKDVTAGFEPQLPLLALIAEMGGFEGLAALKTGELSYWQLKGGREAVLVKLVKGDLAVMAAQAQGNLERLVAEFAKPSTPYRAVPQPRLAPRYNDYAQLARLGEWGRDDQ